jgi:hypothetical protein
MYLETTDLIAVMFALVSSVGMLIFAGVQNARLSRAVSEYRNAYLEIKANQQ